MERVNYKIKRQWLKELINKTFFYVLGKASEFLSKRDEQIKKLTKKLNVNFVKLTILENGPSIKLKKEGTHLMRTNSFGSENIEIFFKNTDSAFLLLTGKIGPEQGFCEHRIFLKGNIANALIFTSILKRVEAILFPGFFHKKLFKKKPKLGFKEYYLRLLLYLFTIFWLIKFPSEKNQ